MIDPAVLDAMLAAGASAEVIVAAVKADAARADARREAQRAGNARRQRRYRDRLHGEGTGDLFESDAGNASHDAAASVTGASPPSLDKSPQTPKINPNPVPPGRNPPARARGASPAPPAAIRTTGGTCWPIAGPSGWR